MCSVKTASTGMEQLSIFVLVFACKHDVKHKVHVRDRLHLSQRHYNAMNAARHLRPLDEIKAEYVASALAKNGGNVSLAAKALGIGRSTFYRRFADVASPPTIDAKLPVRTLDEIDAEYAALALEQSNENVSLAARMMGIGRTTFYRRYKHLIGRQR